MSARDPRDRGDVGLGHLLQPAPVSAALSQRRPPPAARLIPFEQGTALVTTFTRVVAAAARPLVTVEHVSHRYGKAGSSGVLVLDDVDLTLYENEVVGLLGRSGSGKSTLLRSI